MSESPAGLRRQIHNAGDLQTVVRTMKAVAAAAIGQYETSVRALVDYERTVNLALGACLRGLGPQGLGAPRHGRARAGGAALQAVVFGSDQGLVGRFNEVVADHAIAELAKLPQPPQVWAVGERVQARLLGAGLTPQGLFEVPTSVAAITPLVGRILLQSRREGGLSVDSELLLFYNGRGAGASYASACQRLLPLDDQWRRQQLATAWPTQRPPELMAGSRATLAVLIGEYLFISLFRACAESLASENASRLAAMERADRNIDELLAGLGQRFHRLRQSSIDEELFDLVSGFEALAGR